MATIVEYRNRNEALHRMSRALWNDAGKGVTWVNPDGTWNHEAFGKPEPFTPTFRWRVKHSGIAYWWRREAERVRLIWKVIWGLSSGRLQPYQVEVIE